jgi:hypothetical protein
VYYDEYGGWQKCQHNADHVHHVIPEGWLLQHGIDPEDSIGLPLCVFHHVKNEGDEPWDFTSSFHPDIAQAYSHYKGWKERAVQERYLGLPVEPSPFQDALREHRRKEEQGERYWSGTDEMDMFYLDLMSSKAIEYLTAHPDDPKPDTKDNPYYNPDKKKHWYDGFF